MSEHTKEPWVSVALDAGRGIVRAAIASKQGPAFAEFYGFRSIGDRDRATACVNACAGIPTAVLEALPPTDYARLLALASEAAVAAQSRRGLS